MDQRELRQWALDAYDMLVDIKDAQNSALEVGDKLFWFNEGLDSLLERAKPLIAQEARANELTKTLKSILS